ncbi:MAG: PEP-CTERM sorting domain-containing protein [Planctomycetota bacterium]
MRFASLLVCFTAFGLLGFDFAGQSEVSADPVVLTFFDENGDGVNGRGFYDYDVDSGTTTFRRPLDIGSPRALDFAKRPDGRWFATNAQTLPGQLHRVTIDKGQFGLKGETPGTIYQSVEFDPTSGLLYGNTWTGNSNPEQLVTIDPATGQIINVLGNLGAKRMRIGFDDNGNMFGFVGSSSGGSLRGAFYSINKSNGQLTFMSTNNTLIRNVAIDMAYASDGFFYSIDHNSNVYRFDPVTGVGTDLGFTGTGSGIFGVAVNVVNVPEPGTFAAGFAGLGLFAARRRRRA